MEESILGSLVLVPFGFLVGLVTSRICTKIHFSFLRSDIWTTIVVFLVGDILMEWLLPSLKCLPMAGDGLGGNGTFREDEFHYSPYWLLQSFGLVCPADFASTESLLSPDATAVLFSIRLVFLCIGVHVGESVCWIALTGGIATGKTTVGRLLVDCEVVETDEEDDKDENGNNLDGSNASNNNTKNFSKKKPPALSSVKSTGGKRKSRKGGLNSNNTNSTADDNDGDFDGLGGTEENNGGDSGGSGDNDDVYKEGTVNLICADTIAHEVLLPPQILALKQRSRAISTCNAISGAGSNDVKDLSIGSKDGSGSGDHRQTVDVLDVDDDDDDFIVRPQDSVYYNILDAFDGHDILTPDGICIDRLKLGSIIFNNKSERRKLNAITHPRILSVLIRQLIRSVFFGNSDLTIADLPLLFESGLLSWLFAVTICVTVKDPNIQLDRLMKRNPELSKDECQARIDSQMTLKRKARLADIVIDNTGDLEELSRQVEDVRRDLMGRIYGIGMSLLQMLLLIGGSTSIAVSSKFYTNWQD